MALTSNKGKGMPSSNQGTKRARIVQEISWYLNIDPQLMKDLFFRLPYKNIRHTLGGPRALYKVGPSVVEPFDDDDPTDDDQAQVDSSLESDADDGRT
ncbi:hypothetical protein HAX54_030910 [Datura stramonium]|uniref:Uncharacterized protein n=1 Tax=Datura stramonium TaxID=4076 RepID=A0ABS8V959_DATST|nr:hypothetical protein [Datura stramonium]